MPPAHAGLQELWQGTYLAWWDVAASKASIQPDPWKTLMLQHPDEGYILMP